MTSVAASVAAVGLMLFAFRRNPSDLLRVIFIVWVSFPFALLMIGNVLAKRWSDRTRATIQYLTLVVSPFSVLIYLWVVLRPRQAQGAFAFIALPPISVMFIVLVVAMVASIRIRKN
jgi:hypothetical protein